MVIQNYRDIKARAEKTLDYTPWDIRKLVLVFGALPMGINLLLQLMNYLLSIGATGSGGLAGLQIYRMAATASSVLSIAFAIFQLLWSPTILYCGLMVLREQDPWPKGLLRGFSKWAPLIRYCVLVSMILTGIFFIVAPAVTLLCMPLAEDYMDILAQAPTTSQEEMMAYLESVPADQLNRAMLPILIVTLVALLVICVPILFRARFAQLLILDEQQIGARQSLGVSFALTKGNCLQLLRLDLSFWWYYLLLVLCKLIPLGAMLPVFSSWNESLTSALFYALSAVATFGVYMLGLMKVNTAMAVAYDQLRTVPQPDLPQLPEESANG